MIKVLYNDKRIKISGHANFDSYGNDIVCASVSSIVETTINGILNIDNKAIKVTDNKDLVIDVLSNDIVIKKLITNMLELLKELAKQYPKNINVKEN